MAELVELFTGDGLPEEDARVVAGMIAKHPEAMLKAMAEKELGIPTEGGNAPLQTVVISAAFLIGAVVPILPWFVAAEGPLVTIGRFGPSPALLLSVLLAGAALFAVGGFKGRLAGMGTTGGGIQMTAIGLGCATIAYVLGSVIPGLLGIHPLG
jgi:VIT1/CCC1 family predicted Fe2+/Mn2+ transporter